MINSVNLTGRMTSAITLRQTQSGKSVGNFTLAVNRDMKNAQGEREADFINCVAWDKTADVMAQYLQKGSLIGVEGRLQTRSYDKNGTTIYVTEVIVNHLSFLESRREAQPNTTANGGYTANHQVGGYQPSQQNTMFTPSYQSQALPSVSDDDLPF